MTPTLHAIMLMVASTAMLAAMHALVRFVSSDLHPFEIAFFRNCFGLLVILPILIRQGPNSLRTRQPKLQLLRGVIGLGAMLGWFYGLSVVPIAEATAISFSSAIFASLGALVFLGETLRLRRWTAIVIGFIGTLIVLRPGFGTLSLGALLVVFSSVCWGCSVVIVKRLAATDSAVSIVAWMSVMLTITSVVPAYFVWQWPNPEQLAWLLLLGLLGTLGHLAMVNAMKLAETTLILPLDYMRLIWTSLIGYWVFAESPDLWTWVGGSVIFASSAYITYREARLKRKG